ncbi:DNA resolvase [Acetobacter pasteurianus NBRC 3280]|uniref:DNA resolvase n=3 Tax=Acetobacter pasteurianus TaxID=438 RepID=A0A401X8L2_ACEPA|nr:DNA resolvase [Acetobacter pasteurianus NBRC 3277]GCD63999.1 DNA resolvase [Acetobacter pasteurianus NBRC 3278]GCD70442.1 DNA resolvase [Acetobacter pasteurianus NBRC 3280]
MHSRTQPHQNGKSEIYLAHNAVDQAQSTGVMQCSHKEHQGSSCIHGPNSDRSVGRLTIFPDMTCRYLTGACATTRLFSGSPSAASLSQELERPSMMKVALYARYSSDNQRDASIEDQLRICRAYAEKQGWPIVRGYTDHAVSGASLFRSGIQALIADAQQGHFTVILTEALDRLSRDQADVATLFKDLQFMGVRVFTLSEGEITPLHIGLKGTMNALFLKDLAAKTHRGVRGRVEQGKSGGGNAYGYDVVAETDGHGNVMRGARVINDAQAVIVRRIFQDYAAGKSAKKIAVSLNGDHVPCPTGGAWGFSTINGNRTRGTGILNNEIYIGRLVWNRLHYLKDPKTGKRVSRLNPEASWVIRDVPDLRIIDQDLWDAVKARQKTLEASPDIRAGHSHDHFRARRRPKYLFSGLLRCGCCQGGYSMISKHLLGCSNARNKGICANLQNIRREVLEDRVLDALRHRLLNPELFRLFCEEFTKEVNRQRLQGAVDITAAQAELSKVKGKQEKLLDLYLEDQVSRESLAQQSLKLETRRTELEALLASSKAPPPLLHPEMAGVYREQIFRLHEALNSELETQRQEAAEIVRSLIETIILTPSDDGMRIDVRGDLASILTIASGTQKSANAGMRSRFDPGSQVQMVAGAGFEPAAFRL